MVSATPRAAGLSAPAEHAPQRACWLAWPAHRYAWGAHLQAAQAEFVQLAGAMLEAGETLELLVADDACHMAARKAFGEESERLRYHCLDYGDIWLRDTGPMFVGQAEHTAAVLFGFNGWGDKYVYPHDAQVGSSIAAARRLYTYHYPMVLEGGAIEVDGDGLCLSTRQVLLNRNRNPGLSADDVEATLREALGVEQVLWLQDGLRHDHTDGHVDNVARFTGPGCVAHMVPNDDARDPNRTRLAEIERELRSLVGRGEQPLTLHPIVAPGRVESADGEPLPASYVNYLLGNHVLLVPAFGRSEDADAARALGKLYPDRHVLSLPSMALLEGGGSFHCISKQEPA